ncbi:hypothetical protein L6452_19077 [Arctium lappa]|uniref:Uncharacterized protein n=1 Tax=Arctium lappa TaxID=4217 RepID=A0ACB9B8E1_ARCLA|nr:hypothetical protein L6452_19077 [Arctium lappa]
MTVLAEFSVVSGNTRAVARRIHEKFSTDVESKLCFSHKRYIFHILRYDSLTFLCMSNDTFGRRIPISYLEEIQMSFMKNYGKVAPYAPAYAMNDEFSRLVMEASLCLPADHNLFVLRYAIDKLSYGLLVAMSVRECASELLGSYI